MIDDIEQYFSFTTTLKYEFIFDISTNDLLGKDMNVTLVNPAVDASDGLIFARVVMPNFFIESELGLYGPLYSSSGFTISMWIKYRGK